MLADLARVHAPRALPGIDGNLGNRDGFEGFALEKSSQPEHKEYVTAFMEKRKPDFKNVKRWPIRLQLDKHQRQLGFE